MSSIMAKDKFIAIRNELGRKWVELKVEKPLDGAVILAYAPGFSGENLHNMGIILYRDDICFDAITGDAAEEDYTHWMPLPTPPVCHEVLIKVGANQFPVNVDPELPPDNIVIRGRDKVHTYTIVDDAGNWGNEFDKENNDDGEGDKE